jgi:hypothetical protein
MSSNASSRSVALLLGVALVVAAVAPAVGSAALSLQSVDASSDAVTDAVPPSIAQSNGTTNYLQVPDGDVRSSSIERASVDVTAATRIGTDEVEIQLAVETFRTSFDNAESEAERTAAVRDIVQALDRKTETLQTRQAAALERYNTGAISSKQLLSTLARLDASAEEIQDATDAVATKEENTLDYTIPPALGNRLRSFDARLLPVEGKIRNVELQSAVQGTTESPPLYVETGNNGIVLATIVNDNYAREAFNSTAFAPGEPSNLTIYSDALDRMAILYPWAMNPENRNSAPRVDTLWNTSVFSVTTQHRQGTLNVYLDASTTNVFREDQTRDLDAVPVQTVATNATTTVKLTVNTTHETGPLAIELTRPGTDNPVEGEVYVDETFVGTTGEDGTLWTIDTRGETSVRVLTDEGIELSARIPANATAD